MTGPTDKPPYLELVEATMSAAESSGTLSRSDVSVLAEALVHTLRNALVPSREWLRLGEAAKAEPGVLRALDVADLLAHLLNGDERAASDFCACLCPRSVHTREDGACGRCGCPAFESATALKWARTILAQEAGTRAVIPIDDRARGHLTAAAPLMREALEAVQEWIDDLRGQGYSISPNDHVARLVELALDAAETTEAVAVTVTASEASR